MKTERSGFTLIEVMVGVLLTSVVVSLAAGMSFAFTDTLSAIQRSVGRTSVASNGRVWLRELALTVDVRDEPGFVFEGSATRCRFAASVWTAGGWGEATPVTISLEPGPLGGTVVIKGIGRGRIPVAQVSNDARIEYLILSSGSPIWVQEWTTRTIPPIAIRIGDGSSADLVFLTGERG